MAPIKPMNNLAVKDKVQESRVSKPKNTSGPVRKLENGLLSVDRKAGKYVPIIKKNAQTPLLSLPAEIRNQIWGCVLGGQVFDIVRVFRARKRGRRRYYRQLAADTPYNFLSLLSTCRSIYAETCLMPLTTNDFRILVGQNMNWIGHLLPGHQDAVATIRIASKWAMTFLDHNSGYVAWLYYGPLPASLAETSQLLNLKRLVVEVYDAICVRPTQAENIKEYMNRVCETATVSFEFFKSD